MNLKDKNDGNLNKSIKNGEVIIEKIESSA
jgi:hypothetical protein